MNRKRHTVPAPKSKRDVIREYNELVRRFNRVATLAKISTAALMKEKPDHVFFNLKAGVYNQEQLDVTRKFIDDGEFERITELVDDNMKREGDPEHECPGAKETIEKGSEAEKEARDAEEKN